MSSPNHRGPPGSKPYRSCHGYGSGQVPGEDFYRFADGWNAYALFKIPDNGQVLRLFIDQSDADRPAQIIRHWNHVYGYTAHHLAVRATRQAYGGRVAIGLPELSRILQRHGVEVMTPMGECTAGRLLQVTRPERNCGVPGRVLPGLRDAGKPCAG